MESFFHMCTQVRTKDFARVQMRENKRVISNTVNFFVSIVTYLKYNNDVIILKKKIMRTVLFVNEFTKISYYNFFKLVHKQYCKNIGL